MNILDRVYDVTVRFSGKKPAMRFTIEAEQYEPLFLAKTANNEPPEIDRRLLELIGYWAQEGIYIKPGESESLIFDEILSDFGIDWSYSPADDDEGQPTGESATVQYHRTK